MLKVGPVIDGGTTAISMSDVAKHSKTDDCWIAINGDAYNVSDFMDEHPGGAKVLMVYAGKDASDDFNMPHKPDILPRYAGILKVGPIKSKL